MYDRAQLDKELDRDEGVKNRVYRDSIRTPSHPNGYLSVGTGWNLDVNGIPDEVKSLLPPGDPLDPNYVWPKIALDMLLDIGVDMAARVLDKLTPNWRSFSDVRARVLLNLAFNMGEGDGEHHGLSSFKHFLAAVNAEDWQTASAHLAASTTWRSQVGPRAERLIYMCANDTIEGMGA